uniref:BTB domain-containing protein n=4 Tax=Schistocephalus solidus TaxID=70667 RepID=A0A0X3PVA7_SCHSO
MVTPAEPLEVQQFEDEFPLARSCPKLDELRIAHEFTDLTIQLKEEKFLHVHRLILASRVPSLRAAMMQSVSVLKWPTVSIESASSLIDYLYTGRIEISSDNAMQMILLSKQLSLPWVEDWAVSFLSVRLQNDNLSESWNFATAVNCEGLRDACVHHMKIFFEASVASAFFSELPADVLLSILRDDDLQVDSEEKVFEAIKRWVRPTGTVDEHRIIHAPEMLREVRWSQTKHRFRRRLIEGDDIIVSSAECMQCVGLADHWIGFSILRTQESCPFNTNNRPASLATSVFVFGKSALEDRCLIYQYDLEENSCEELTTVEGLEGATFVSFGESIVVIGGKASGQNWTSGRVDEYRTRERRWRRLPDLQTARADHAVVVVTVGVDAEDALVFVCGGFYRSKNDESDVPLRSCEAFDLRHNRWYRLPQLLEKRDATAATTLSDGRIFVFGGWNGKSCLASVESCHLQADWSQTIETSTTEDFWRPLASMRVPRYFHAAVAFKGKIIVAGGNTADGDDNHNRQRIVEVFSPPDAERPLGEWTRVVDLHRICWPGALLVYKDRVYAMVVATHVADSTLPSVRFSVHQSDPTFFIRIFHPNSGLGKEHL